jgi:UDPglucose--hexose-1-phosphate uridylyltransferase
MPELRKDPITGRWVIISSDRGKRPAEFADQRAKKRGGFCPFCAGNERTTPHEILAFREGGQPNGPDWRLRVVPNKFPALQIEGDLNKQGEGIFDKMNGLGAHEVIIETPDHNATLATLPLRALEEVLYAYRDRMEDLKKDRRFQYTLYSRMRASSPARRWSTPTPSSSPCPSCRSWCRRRSRAAGGTTT